MSKVKGGAKLRRKLKRFPEEATGELKEEIEDGARQLQAETVRRIPRDSGDLANALKSKSAVGKKDKGLKWEFGLRGKKLQRDFFYWRFVEYGTKGFSGTDRRGRQITIPPMRARPALRPALEKVRKGMRKRIDQAMDRALDKVRRQS